MADKITFELVSPERLLLSKPVDMVVVPGSEGLFGVLAGHTPLIALLKPGVIDVHDGGQIINRIFVGGGFAEVVPERCVVLAEMALPIEEIDRGRVQQRIDELRAGEGAAQSPVPLPDDSGLVSELALNIAMLAALDAKPV